MSQQIQINYGAAPNDGQGDPLRTAFIKTDENFDNIWLAGPVGSNVTIANNTISVADTNGNLILSPNGIGTIQTNSRLAPRTTLTYDIGSQALRYRNVYAVGVDVANAVLGNLSNITIAVANLHVLGGSDGYVLQTDGAGNLAWTAQTNGAPGGVNTQIQFNNAGSFGGQTGFTFNKTSNVLSVPGNVTATGNVTGNYFLGNGSQLTGIVSSYGNANVVANLAALGANPISTTGNITGNYFLGNGSQLTGIAATYGNSNVTTLLASLGSNIISGTGNITTTANVSGAYILGSGSQLTNLPAPVVTQDITSNGAMSIMTYDGVIKYVSYATVEPATGNISAGNVLTTGNVSGNYFIGNGSQLTGISSASTGNVTFSGEAVIGTGTSNTQSGLYLAPDPVSLANDLYLRVRGNIYDEPTHIHFDTGNNQYYNQFIGDDNKYIQLANTGNIVINTSDYAGNTAQWTFGTDGVLTLPALSGQIGLAGYTNGIDLYNNNGGTGYVRMNYADESLVWADSGGSHIQTTGGTWDFDTTGNLSAPGNINATGNVTGGNIVTAGSGGDISLTGGNITGAGNISATGNITSAYLFGNGSQLTGITASVPSQTILPTIQDITVVARPAGLFGGGQGGANVTVANTIPVTEYGVIITDGTTSEKYKTGSLGSIPGTVSLTFTTGLNSTQFTVFAYVTSNAGTYYSGSATGTSGICLLSGTQIALSDGTRKAIEDITYTDKMLSWDFDRGCYAETTAVWIKRGETGSQYNLLTFSDGTTLRTFDQHRIFNKQAGAFTYPMTDATPIGTVTVNEHGQEITLTNKQVIVDTIEYYNVITDHHMNLFSDSILTSCRFNNIYPITDMKFVKDGRTLRTRDEFENIPDKFFYGLRLAEQTFELSMIEWYVNRLLSIEVSTTSELTV